jgi:hypothetical protein
MIAAENGRVLVEFNCGKRCGISDENGDESEQNDDQ